MKTIWKFKLNEGDRQVISMPKNAQILSIQSQYGEPCMWVLVDVKDDVELEDRIFETFGTGHEIHYDMGIDRTHIGTYQVAGGSFIGHVFERIS